MERALDRTRLTKAEKLVAMAHRSTDVFGPVDTYWEKIHMQEIIDILCVSCSAVPSADYATKYRLSDGSSIVFTEDGDDITITLGDTEK